MKYLLNKFERKVYWEHSKDLYLFSPDSTSPPYSKTVLSLCQFNAVPVFFKLFTKSRVGSYRPIDN